MIEGLQNNEDYIIGDEKNFLFDNATKALNDTQEGEEKDKNDESIDKDRYDWTISYIQLTGKKGVLKSKRSPENNKCALYNAKNEKISKDYSSIRPLFNEKGEWNRLFIAGNTKNEYCLVNEWGNEASKYYVSISNIVYKPVGGNLSDLREGHPIGVFGRELSFVGKKADGTKVVVENGNERKI